MGFFSKEQVEIMAAIDTPAVAAEPKAVEPSRKEAVQAAAVQSELATMRNLLERALSRMPQDEEQYPVLELLLENDVDRQIAEKIVDKLPVNYKNLDIENIELKRWIIHQIQEQLHTIEGITIPDNGRKVVAFIGATGVGKTTTIAKLAAEFAIQKGYKVALVTADTYRISAVEQLKTYSDIMGMPIHVVYTGNELKNVLDTNLDKQLILIDTAGRSPQNSDQMEELKALLQVDDTIEKYLVLSATTKYKDALDIVEKFSLCQPDKVIFTKIDETRNIGTIVNLIYEFPLPLSYMTTGQNVPDDIELVDPDKLVQLILRD